MTKREQALLAAMAALAICILPYAFVFRGMTAEKKELENKLLQQQDVIAQISATKAAMEENRQTFALRWDELNAARSRFSYVTTTYDAHNIFTRLAAQNNMSILNLKIQDLQTMKLDEAVLQAETPPPAEAPSADTMDGTSLPPYSYTPPEYDPLYPCRMQVDMSVTGSLEDSLRLIDAIATEGDSYRLQSVTYSSLEPDELGNVNLMLSASIYLAATAAEGGFNP